MANYNKVILVGNLTRDPEIKYTAGGSAVVTMGLAVNRKYQLNEETKEEVLFVDVVVFGKQAENVNQYLQKGRPVLVDGRLSYRTWEGKDGQKKSKHEVVATTVQFLGGGPKGAGGESTAAPSHEIPTITEDDIPF
jgi:single-strand DNA-binding protein